MPSLDTGNPTLPEGWLWSPKYDDERVVYAGGKLYNRHGRPFTKAKLWPELPVLDIRLDLLAMGYRTRTEKHWILLDVVGDAPFAERTQVSVEVWAHLREVDLRTFTHYHNARYVWDRYRNDPLCEGIVGRDPSAPYLFGETRRMVKIKWR